MEAWDSNLDFGSHPVATNIAPIPSPVARHRDSNHTVWVTLRIIIRVKIRDRTWVIGRLRGRIAVSFMCKTLGLLAEVTTRGNGCTRVSGRILCSGCSCGGGCIVLVPVGA